MLSFHAQLKVFLATAPCDLRIHSEPLIIPSSVRG